MKILLVVPGVLLLVILLWGFRWKIIATAEANFIAKQYIPMSDAQISECIHETIEHYIKKKMMFLAASPTT